MATNVPSRPELVGPIIAGAIGAVFVMVLIVVMIYFYIRGPPPPELEDGVVEKPQLSGRKWFSSKTGRFRDDGDQPVKKLSAVPRYLRVFRKSAGWKNTEPTPKSPTVPRSARLVAGDSMYTLSLPPSASPTTDDPFNQMDRSDRRKVQLAAQPVAPLPALKSPRALQSPRGLQSPRKPSALSNVLHPGDQKPLTREQIMKQLAEKQETVAQLEEHRQRGHQPNTSISSLSTTSTCVVEQDITELRKEVAALEKMLPERNADHKYV